MPDRIVFAPNKEVQPSWFAFGRKAFPDANLGIASRLSALAGYALLAVFLMLEMMLILGGTPPIDEPWDMSLLLDGGWRIVSGQVPHTDFHNPIGPLPSLLVAFGMKIAAPSTSSIAYGSALLLLMLLPLAWYIVSVRTSWAITLIFVVFAGFFLVSPRPPGFGIRETSYAMIYNRQGYVLLSILLLAVFVKPRESAERSVSVEGLLVGVLLALLLYCKITYFLAGTVLTAFGALVQSRPLRWFLALAGAFAGVCVAFFAIFHINLHSYLSDVVTAGYAQSPSGRITLLSLAVRNNVTRIYFLFFCVGLCTWAEIWAGKPRFSALRMWLVTGAIIAVALLISAGNAAQPPGDDPLYFVAAVILLESFRNENPAEVAKPRTTMRLVYLASFVLMLPWFTGMILARDVASAAYVVRWDVTKRPALAESQRMHSVSLRDFYVPSSSGHVTAYWLAREYPARINDGIDILQRYRQESDRVTVIGHTNPFSFALGSVPAHDWLLWWRPNYSYDPKHAPPEEAFLGASTLVMVPRVSADRFGVEEVDVLLDLYGNYLRAHFHELASNDTWTLFRRN